jgi:hypothetical protein
VPGALLDGSDDDADRLHRGAVSTLCRLGGLRNFDVFFGHPHAPQFLDWNPAHVLPQ